MFKKMQIKLTLLFTIILMFIILGTNVAVYLVLSSYNKTQIVFETDKMLKSISSSEWLQSEESDENPILIDGVREEYDDYDEEDEEDEEDEDEEDEDKEDEEDEDKEDEDKEDEDKEDNDDSKIDSIHKISVNTLVIKKSIRKKNTTTYDDGDDEAIEVHLSDEEELIIPRALEAFSFYFIYDVKGKLLKWKNDYNDLSEELFELSENLSVDDKPKVIDIEDEQSLSFLIQKLPIIIDGEVLGYYTVGRDVSIANQTIDNLFVILIFSLIIGTIISAVIGYLLAGRVIKPMKEAYISKERFLADASHELRTPLSVVMLSCDTLEEGNQLQDEFSKKIISGIKDETHMMTDLVEKLLHFARVDTGRNKAIKESIDISKILQSNVDAYEHIAFKDEIEIISNIEANLIINGDKQMLNSLVSILIDNAIKYNSKKGKVNVLGKITYKKNKRYVEISVSDTGKGIAHDEIKNVFSRFYRVDKSRTKSVQGHGLGLSIAQEIISKHKGEVKLDSTLNKGSTFRVLLPQLKK